MVCFRPMTMFDDGRHDKSGKFKYAFYRTSKTTGFSPVVVPCGKCIGCRLSKAKEWSLRCEHELMYHKKSSFLTLTYSPENIHEDYTLVKAHMTSFIKRLRYYYPNVKIQYLQCGEYGGKKGRPHHHMILYGLDFAEDREFYKKTKQGNFLYTSKKLNSIWKQGYCIIGEVTPQSVQYVCRYTLKKVYGENAKKHYGKREPEYITSSRKPAIGRKFWERYKFDFFKNDFIMSNGFKNRIPRYYNTLMERYFPDLFEDIKRKRRKKAIAHAEKMQLTKERLYEMEQTVLSRVKKLKRGYELQTC